MFLTNSVSITPARVDLVDSSGGVAPFASNGALIPIYPIITYPSAYYYNGVTYVVYEGPDENPYVTAYSHGAGTWATPVQVGTNPLTDDDHGAPAIIVDNSGYIHVYFGSHITALKHSRSTNTEDITAWTAQTDIGTYTSYPNVVKADDGTLHLFFRLDAPDPDYNGDLAWTTSADYTSITAIITHSATGDRIYHGNMEYDSATDRIYIAWCYYDKSPSDARVNIYAAYLDLTDSHLYNLAGTDLGTTIDITEATNNCRLVDIYGSGYETNSPALHLDGSGYPHLIYAQSSATGSDYYHLYWNGSAWSTPAVITDADNIFNYPDFYFSGASQIEAYLTTNSASEALADRSGDLEHWRWSGGSWAFVSTVFTASTDAVYDGANYPNAVVNGLDALRVVFGDNDDGEFSTDDQNIYALDSTDAYVH